MVICRLGQLASMAGIEPSDFGVLNCPQLSSTKRREDGEQVSEQRKDSMAVFVSFFQEILQQIMKYIFIS